VPVIQSLLGTPARFGRLFGLGFRYERLGLTPFHAMGKILLATQFNISLRGC
jgi:hypothetical protein